MILTIRDDTSINMDNVSCVMLGQWVPFDQDNPVYAVYAIFGGPWVPTATDIGNAVATWVTDNWEDGCTVQKRLGNYLTSRVGGISMSEVAAGISSPFEASYATGKPKVSKVKQPPEEEPGKPAEPHRKAADSEETHARSEGHSKKVRHSR